MTDFCTQLKGDWSRLESIRKQFEQLPKGLISKDEELKLSEMEDDINELYVILLGKRIDFQRHWKPSFEMHRDSRNFESFSGIVAGRNT